LILSLTFILANARAQDEAHDYDSTYDSTYEYDTDTDGDGISDYDEVNGYEVFVLSRADLIWTFTDPTNPDSDGDGITDGGELVESLSDPNDPSDPLLMSDPLDQPTSDEPIIEPSGQEVPDSNSGTESDPVEVPDSGTEEAEPETDPYDLPWYEDLSNWGASVLENLFFSPSPIPIDTFEAIEGGYGVLDDTNQHHQAIQNALDNIDDEGSRIVDPEQQPGLSE
jgi:hypothetical protein